MKKLTLIFMMIVISAFAYAEGIDDDTVLMLHGDGDASDDSINGHAEFDGNDDYFSGTNDFGITDALSISAWIYLVEDKHGNIITKNDPRKNGFSVFRFYYMNPGKISVKVEDSATNAWPTWLTDENIIPLNQWTHVVFTWNTQDFNASDGRIYVNGQDATYDYSESSYGSSFALNDVSSEWRIGNLLIPDMGSTDKIFNGSMDEIAVYNRMLSAQEVDDLYQLGLQGLSNNITNSMQAYYPLDSDFDDYSGNNNDGTASGAYTFAGHTVTANGNPQLDATTKKIGSGSMYFDGTGDYLSIPDSDDFDFINGDWTVDFWFNLKGGTQNQALVNHLDHNTNNQFDWKITYKKDTDSLRIEYYCGGWQDLDTVALINYDEWHHVALVRDSSTLRLFMDGTMINTNSIGSCSGQGSNQPVRIGAAWGTTYGYVNYFNGSIDEVRISDTARWTSSFTPDTSPYSADANTTLLLHMDGDESDSNHTVTFNGDADLSATSKWDGSLYFDGSGDYLSIPDSDNFDFGSDDFTIDAWVYPIQAAADHHDGIVGKWGDGSGSAGNKSFDLVITSGGTNVRFQASDDGAANSVVLDSTTALSLNNWHHIGVVRDSNTWMLFIDGILEDTETSSISIFDNQESLFVGTQAYSLATDFLNGHIDELRISKGVARWTSDFTPDTTPYSSTSGGSTPTYNNFTDSETTNFSEADDITNVTNVTLAVTGKGKIKFPESYGINAENQDFDSNIVIDDEFISVNTAALDSSFNSSATISIEGVTCPVDVITYKEGSFAAKDDILAGGSNCILDGVCSNVVCSAGTLTFDVAHFTGFAAGGNANLTIWADSGIYYENQSVGFHASYINSTDGTPLSGECNISFSDAWGTWYEMDYNGSEYNYSRNFTTAGLKNYNVSCYNSSYIELEATDSKLITSLSGDVPEFSLLTLGLGLAIILAGLYVIKRR